MKGREITVLENILFKNVLSSLLVCIFDDLQPKVWQDKAKAEFYAFNIPHPFGKQRTTFNSIDAPS